MSLSEAVANAYLAAEKHLIGTMEWVTVLQGGSDVSEVLIVVGGLQDGHLKLVQVPGDERHWKFVLNRGRNDQVLRWEFDPPGKPRRHPNPYPVPPGFPAIDTSPVHEHPIVDPYGTACSRPLGGLDLYDHRQAFLAFCDRANIDARGIYTPPPEPQLSLIP